jgi:hypothetical protein
MKNKAVNGLVAIALSLIFIEGVPYVSIALTIYGLWLASQVLKKTENSGKRNRVIAIITSVIGYPLIIVLFIIFFKQFF